MWRAAFFATAIRPAPSVVLRRSRHTRKLVRKVIWAIKIAKTYHDVVPTAMHLCGPLEVSNDMSSLRTRDGRTVPASLI